MDIDFKVRPQGLDTSAIHHRGNAIPVLTSNDAEREALISSAQDVLPYVGSRFPVVDRYRFSLTSSSVQKNPDVNAANIVSARISSQFRKDRRLPAALNIEDAPHELVSEVVVQLLRSTKFDDSELIQAMSMAFYVGHCDLLDVLSDHLRQFSSISYIQFFDRASCGDVTRLSSLRLKDLLKCTLCRDLHSCRWSMPSIAILVTAPFSTTRRGIHKAAATP